jgi:hypothetical protein
MPVKILVGMQTGETRHRGGRRRVGADQHVASGKRRGPNIMNWSADWSEVEDHSGDGLVSRPADLTESSMVEKVDRAVKMADVNQKMGTSAYVFTDEEIRQVVGLEPLSDADKYRDEPTDDEQAAALGKPAAEPAPNKE